MDFNIKKLRDISILSILGINNNGRRQSIKCPFHGEKNSSLMIYPDNHYHCFGCGRHGKGAIDFLLESGCSFSEAIKELNNFT